MYIWRSPGPLSGSFSVLRVFDKSFPPHDKQWCCFRASSGSRKYKAVRVAPCFPENPCAVCGKACGLTERELNRTRHPCGAGCGCRCALCGCCRYTNAGECERMLCEDTVPEDVVGNTVASVAAGGLSAIATALTSVGRSVEQLTRQQLERQQRRQREAPAPAEMHRGYAPHPPPSNYPGAPAGTQWEVHRQVYEQSPYPQPNYAPPPPAQPRPETGDWRPVRTSGCGRAREPVGAAHRAPVPIRSRRHRAVGSNPGRGSNPRRSDARGAGQGGGGQGCDGGEGCGHEGGQGCEGDGVEDGHDVGEGYAGRW